MGFTEKENQWRMGEGDELGEANLKEMTLCENKLRNEIEYFLPFCLYHTKQEKVGNPRAGVKVAQLEITLMVRPREEKLAMATVTQGLVHSCSLAPILSCA